MLFNQRALNTVAINAGTGQKTLTVDASAVLQGSAPLAFELTGLSGRLEMSTDGIYQPETLTFGDVSARLILSMFLTVGDAMAAYIEPQTDALLDITVKDAGALVTDAVVTAVGVWSPLGTQVASSVSMAHQGSGVYRLNIARAWSESSGKAVEGEFMVEIKAARGGIERRRRFRYVVKFDDED